MLRASLQTGAVGADGPTDRPAQPAALDPLQCRLLTLLADGADDRSAAEELGISERTVRRHVARISQAVGGRTRFQTAVLAAQRGWV